jgi:serine/threonine protein kinase
MAGQLKTLPSLLETQAGNIQVGLCLSDDDILAFAQGELSAHERDSIHTHMDQCRDCQRLLAETTRALDMAPIADTGRICWNTVFQPNSFIGERYRIVRLVARGGMGEVYEAIDETLHVRVALKTVTSIACDSVRAVRHLKGEVQLARRITHPNVCRIFDLGAHRIKPSGDEISFLVMEFVEGECLGKKLRAGGALPLALAQSIARQLLLGLRAAHCAGILHRDFKSENVMIRTDDAGHVNAVILDFGLAKALNENGSATITQGQGNAIIGTVGYIAPEQLEGKPLSRASDIYAFGVVFYEMLTGRLPFESGSPAASAIARLHRNAEPPSNFSSTVPKWLDQIVLRCLNRQRSSRYADAQQVLDALSTGASRHPSEPLLAATVYRRYWLGGALALSSLLAVTLIVKQGIIQHELRPTVTVAPQYTARLQWQPRPMVALTERDALAVGSVNGDRSGSGRKRTTIDHTGTETGKPTKAASMLPAHKPTRGSSRVAPSAPEESAAPTHPTESYDANDSPEPSKSDGWLPLWGKSATSKSQPITN